MMSKLKQRMKSWDFLIAKHTIKAIDSSNPSSSVPDFLHDPLYRDADAMYQSVQSAISMLIEEDNEDRSNDHDDLCIEDYTSDCESSPNENAVLECDLTSVHETQLPKNLRRSFIIDDCDSDDGMLESLNQNSENNVEDQRTSALCPSSQNNVLKDITDHVSQSYVLKTASKPQKRPQNRESSTSPITFESPLFTSTQTLNSRNFTVRHSTPQRHAAQSSTPVRLRQSFSNRYGKQRPSPKPAKTDHNPVELFKVSSPIKRCSPKLIKRHQRVPSAQNGNKKKNLDNQSDAEVDDKIINVEPETPQAIVDMTRTPPARLRRKRADTVERNKSKLRHLSSKHVKRLHCTSSKQLRDEPSMVSRNEEHQGCMFDEKVNLDQDTANQWVGGTVRSHSTNIPGILSIDGHSSLTNHDSAVDDKSSLVVNTDNESVVDCEENGCAENYEWSLEQRHHFTSWWLNTAGNDDKYSSTCDDSSLHFDPFVSCYSEENCPYRGTFDQSSSMAPSVVKEELQEQIDNIDVLFDGQELLRLSSKSAKSETSISSDGRGNLRVRRFSLVRK